MKQLYLIITLGVLCLGRAVSQPIPISTLNSPYQQDFNTLANSAPSTTLPPGWLFFESGSNANTFYVIGTGSGTAGDTYSFGSVSSTERALGTLRSGSLIPTIGAAFTNTSGSTITSVQISYRAEQWRLGASRAAGVFDRLDFQISFDATSLTNGTWTDINELDFTSLLNTGSVGAVNGNTTNTNIVFEIPGLAIPSGQTFYIRWSDLDVSSSDDGLAIDDFSLTAMGTTLEPSITFSPAALAFGDVDAGTQQTLSYEVVASNIGPEIVITSDNGLFTISADNVVFGSSASIPSAGGNVWVRFAPVANGAASASITHAAGTYSATLAATGFGFIQSENIIPIAEARQKSSGTKVTVAGRITVANEHGNPAFMQDETGGIPVFNAALASSVQIGDSVIVTGPIGFFNDQIQISGTGIFFTEVAAPSRIPEPKVIVVSEMAANEGLLVKIAGVELVNKSFVFYPQSTERIADGSGQGDLRIDGDTDIPGLAKPQGTFDVTGVVGRFRANAQLLPRFQPDIPAATEPTTPTDGISKALTLDVVNWNFEFFGARSEDYAGEEFGPADEELQLQNIKQVLQSLNADVIAVQEVSDEAYLGTLVAELGDYSYLCSQRYSYSFEGPSTEFPPQMVCFIYNTSTVTIENARPMFEALYDQARTGNPAVLPGYPTGDPSSFYSSGRLPLLVNATATIQGVTEQVSFVVLHAKSGATAGDFNRRVYDAAVLKDTLDAHFGDKQVIILGDLNDDLDQSIVSGSPTSYASIVNDANYHAITKPLSEAGARSTVSFQDVIDHQIITTELDEAYLEGSATIIAPFRTVENYANTTSDHLPVISRFQFTAPVVSFVNNSSAVGEDAAPVLVELSLTKGPKQPTSLTINLSGSAVTGQDFTTSIPAISNVITVPLAAGQTSASFTITLVNDQADEDAENAVFTIAPAAGIDVSNGSYTLTINDNDIPTIGFKDLYTKVREGASESIILKLSNPVATDQQVTIRITESKKAEYGKDYTTTPEAVDRQITLPVPAGSADVSITIDALNDKPTEKLELLYFQITGTSAGLTRSQRSFTIVGIENTKKHPVFSVYPNPTKNFFKIYAEDYDDDETVYVELADPSGRKIFSKKGGLDDINGKIKDSLVGRRNGVYTLLILADGETTILRIIKQ
ncbi:MAG TPA: DUF5689 domain-containing protein [Chryseosolibacter sp.]